VNIQNSGYELETNPTSLESKQVNHGLTSCQIFVSLQICGRLRKIIHSKCLWTFTEVPLNCSLEVPLNCSLEVPLNCSLEVPLDIEEYVSFAGVDCLEVGLFYTAVVEVEPGFVVGGKGSVVA